MPCCLIIAASVFPRLTLAVMALTGYGGRAFETILWPLLGFFFMPYTTCAYAIGTNAHGKMTGWALCLLIIGVFLDLGSTGGGARYRRGAHYRVERR